MKPLFNVVCEPFAGSSPPSAKSDRNTRQTEVFEFDNYDLKERSEVERIQTTRERGDTGSYGMWCGGNSSVQMFSHKQFKKKNSPQLQDCNKSS